ncbi:LAGLIDADG family homing endonuclease [Candidatus Woesearchaeota archaeon]|nr:LAGLIDADG family homing endonuclease [Candidatus Woesearchaeota archaeon]
MNLYKENEKAVRGSIASQCNPSQFALFYGALLGDGCLSKVGKHHYFISIVGHLVDDYEFISTIIHPIMEFLVLKKIKIRKSNKECKCEIVICNKKLFFRLNEIGFPIGKKGAKLDIPSSFSRDECKYLIQGYFATDGCLVLTNNNGILYPRIEFSGISKPLLKKVLVYLRSVGMKGKLYVKREYPNSSWNTIFRLQFNGKKNLECFRNQIGFINPKHNKKYNNWKRARG